MDLERIESLLKLMADYGVAELEAEDAGGRVRLRMDAPPVPVRPMAVAVDTPVEPEVEGVFVNAPMVGTFYRSPKPGAPPFVEVGDRVHSGQVLCIIEAMKLMNELESETDGIVAEIRVDNAQPVQFAQPLFRIVAQ